MGSSSNQENHQDTNAMAQPQVVVLMVPFPAQSHLNQLLQLSCLISSYGIPVHYVGSALYNQQAKVRANGLDPLDIAKIQFHDIPTPSFASPPPNPNSSHKFPAHLQPAWDATLNLRSPIAAYSQEMSRKAKRVVIVHDSMMAYAVQDAASIINAETYAFASASANFSAYYMLKGLGKPFPIEYPKELPSLEGCFTDEFQYFGALQSQAWKCKAGDIYNTCRLIEGPYLEILEKEGILGNLKAWAVGPIIPTKLSSENKAESQPKSLEWLDEQEPKSVIYVSFGTTNSLSDDQIKEVAFGLEESKHKFLWVLRDADKADIFDREVRKAELPGGFEDRLKGVGMVIRDWAPQAEILAHPSTGGFMSHCGWNSCMESIINGVPMAAWPMHSDQPTNAFLITEVLKLGLIVREWKQREQLVEASVIKNAVTRLMASEEGNEMRKRVEELGVTVRRAIQQGGASRLELDAFVAHITR